MSIPDFVGNMRAYPLLIPNKYEVAINGPVAIPKELTFNCMSVAIPARSVATVERFVYGPSTKIPYVEIFDDLNITFRLSADMVERAFVDDWLDKIGGEKYGAAYFDEIKGNVTVKVLHLNDQLMKTYNFYDAYPLSVSETTLSQDSEEISLITVQFAYHHYDSK